MPFAHILSRPMASIAGTFTIAFIAFVRIGNLSWPNETKVLQLSTGAQYGLSAAGDEYGLQSFRLVDSYGAFGPISRPRYTIIVEGTGEVDLSASKEWREHECKANPGDPGTLSAPENRPWFEPFSGKLLVCDRPVLLILRTNPCPAQLPGFAGAQLYGFRFTTPTKRAYTGAWRPRTPSSRSFPLVSAAPDYALE